MTIELTIEDFRKKNWMKSENVSADTALINDDLLQCVTQVKANAAIFLSQSQDQE